MAGFPRTKIENLSVSRMIIGSNWMLGFSHTSDAKSRQIVASQNAKSMASIIEVFLNSGVDTLMTPLWVHRGGLHTVLVRAINAAQDRTGKKVHIIATPSLNVFDTPEADAENARTLDKMAELGAEVCMPHTSSTDALVDVRNRRITNMDKYCRMMRERGMIPGLSTHMPEAIIYADETNLDVATYISIYNAAGFLMHVEADWTRDIIWRSKHPVITIKPLAAGRLLPLVGLGFVWSTIREKDMVTIGCMTADEAREVVDLSLALLSHSWKDIKLQGTRSKQSVTRKK